MIRGISRRVCLATLVLLLVSSFMYARGVPETPVPGQEQRATNASAEYPMEVSDALGTTVVIQEKPESLVSLSLFSDEVLIGLGAEDHFLGVSELAVDPVYSNVAETASTIGTNIEFNVEQIISLSPDIVFAADWSDGDRVSQLQDAGIPVYRTRTSFTIPDIQEEIRTLARIMGETEAAEDMISAMDARIAELQSTVSTIPDEQRLSGIEYNTWGTSSGVNTTWHEVLRLAGVHNAAAEFEEDDFGMVPMSKELIVDLDPDIIFLPGFIWGEDDAAQEFADQVMNDPALEGLEAIESERVYMIPEHLKGTYSQYIVDAAEHLAQLVYPDYF
ncbi:MAG: ABC transporter substrate-binding protein [Spirochaetaceae bacterium]